MIEIVDRYSATGTPHPDDNSCDECEGMGMYPCQASKLNKALEQLFLTEDICLPASNKQIAELVEEYIRQAKDKIIQLLLKARIDELKLLLSEEESTNKKGTI